MTSITLRRKYTGKHRGRRLTRTRRYAKRAIALSVLAFTLGGIPPAPGAGRQMAS